MQIHLGVLALSLLSFSPAEALQISSTSPALPSQSATVTTLPPAQPSGNDKNPCDFTDRNELLNRVVSDWQGYNISLLVETCPNVCVLIYGDGNPDVSGIGVLVSYVWQFVSIVVFGPGLVYLFAFKERYSDAFNQFLFMIASEILPAIIRGNNWIMLSVLVASIIRLSQSPPVFEMDFIFALIWFQWIMALAGAVTTSTIANWLNDSRLKKTGLISALFTFFTLIIAFVMSTSSGYPAGASQSDALVAISQFCAFENDLPVPLHEDSSGTQKELPLWESILLAFAVPLIAIVTITVFLALSLVGIAVFMVVLGLLSTVGHIPGLAAYAVWKWLKRNVRLIWAKLPKLLKKQLAEVGKWALMALSVVFLLLPFIIWFAISVWVLRLMQSYRNNLQKALGKQYQDSYWGFGQVTIVVMLLPSIYEVLSKIIRFRPKSKEENHESQPLVGSDPSSRRSSMDEHMNLQFDLPASGEGRNHGIQSTAESSRKSNRTLDVNAPHDAGSGATNAEEGLELKQRVNTFPKDADGNTLPVHN